MTRTASTASAILFWGVLGWSTTTWWSWVLGSPFWASTVYCAIWSAEAVMFAVLGVWVHRVNRQLRRYDPRPGGRPPRRRPAVAKPPPNWGGVLTPSGGPTGARLEMPGGRAIPLVVLPNRHDTSDGWFVWLAFGPAGEVVPIAADLVFDELPPRTRVLVQTEENMWGQEVFSPTPTAMHTPN